MANSNLLCQKTIEFFMSAAPTKQSLTQAEVLKFSSSVPNILPFLSSMQIFLAFPHKPNQEFLPIDLELSHLLDFLKFWEKSYQKFFGWSFLWIQCVSQWVHYFWVLVHLLFCFLIYSGFLLAWLRSMVSVRLGSLDDFSQFFYSHALIDFCEEFRVGEFIVFFKILLA